MKKLFLGFVILATMMFPMTASAISLTSGNSTVAIAESTQSGVYSWTVDGTNNLFQQWFWYRIGDDSRQSSIDAISAPVISNQTASSVTVTYANQSYSVAVAYTLQGGQANTGRSDLAETITINNLTGSALDFRFFQYSDFDLGGTPGGQTATITTLGGLGRLADQTGGGQELSETIVTPGASRWEANYFANTLNSLNGDTYNLNDVASAGAGDVTWAFQWNQTIGAYGSFQISKDKQLSPVPEPGTLLLLGAGLLGLAGLRRKE